MSFTAMFRNPMSILAVAGLVSSGAAQTLVWSDEFDTFDTTTWEALTGDGSQFGIPGWGNNELQWYTGRSSNVRAENGELVIEARRDSIGGKFYSSARIRTLGQADFGYGRFEARIKLPSTTGIWPAFWMLPTGSPYGNWPSSGEIDIMESTNFADRIVGTLHFGNEGEGSVQNGGAIETGEDYSQQYAVYRIDRYPDRMEWYLDGQLYHTAYSTSWFSGATGNFLAPFEQDFHFILNVAVGGNFPGNPNGSSVFPQFMYVDWVRAYEFDDVQTPYVPIEIPGVINMELYDRGGQGFSFNETDENNIGGAFRPSESVDIESTFGGGFHVGWIRPGEWIEYTVNVDGQPGTERTFDLTASVASAVSGGSFRLEVDGQDVSGPISFGGTGAWQTFGNVSGTVTLPAGEQVIRFVNLGSGMSQEFNIDTLTFTATGCGPADLAEPFGVLDLDDVDRFILAFLIGNDAADIAAPLGVLDLADIDTFIASFFAGCP
ncbi:MAG: carbohydrate-binding protein [Planctomycetota bacterium]